jgi:signal transduction histidine kinase
MQSLGVKLTLAFVFVGLTGIGILLLVGVQTQREFDQFMVLRYRADLVTMLEDHYQAYGGWVGMDRLPGNWRPPPTPGVRVMVLNNGERTLYFSDPVTVADQDGRVAYSHARPLGSQLTPEQMAAGTALTVDGAPVGWLFFDAPIVRRPVNDSPEAGFIARVERAILIAVAGALVLAVLSGVLLAQTLTRPVRALTAATRALARGELGRQVVIATNDELGELGQAFNQMSADLARGVKLRRQMTADIAHDLRTPLSVILGYTEALADGKLHATPETFAVLHDEAQHLRHLVDDLRVLSLADAGELTLQPADVAPVELLARVALAHQVQADQKGVKLAVEAVGDLPSLHVDPERMTQVFGNLVSNALRHTPAGGEIRLAAAADEGQVVMQVKDTGIGIAAEDLPFIFERFYRGDKARAQNGESGLGLAIAKSLVEMHGGAIAAAGAPGQGAVFSVRLPASAG